MGRYGVSEENAAWLRFLTSCMVHYSLRIGLQCVRLMKVTKEKVVIAVEDALAYRLLLDPELRRIMDDYAERAYGRRLTVSIVLKPPSDEELALRHRKAGTLQ